MADYFVVCQLVPLYCSVSKPSFENLFLLGFVSLCTMNFDTMRRFHWEFADGTPVLSLMVEKTVRFLELYDCCWVNVIVRFPRVVLIGIPLPFD